MSNRSSLGPREAEIWLRKNMCEHVMMVFGYYSSTQPRVR
jgi:hypothetical protein